MSGLQSRWGRRRVVAAVVAVGLAAAGLSVVAPTAVATAATNTPRTVLSTGQTVAPGHILSTGTFAGANPALNHSFELVLQTNGNLVEYASYPAQGPKYVLWRSDSANVGGAKDLMLTAAGNLLVHGARGTWSSGTIGNAATHLAIASDGNMVLYTAAGHAVWASRTGLCAKQSITNGKISSLISAACRQVAANTWYSWDAGHASNPGPTYGVQDRRTAALAELTENDPHRKGFDCSGLTRWAYSEATGHDIPGGANASGAADQWNNRMTGVGSTTSSTAGVRIGDFLYFSNARDGLHHTAISIGEVGGVQYMVEAPHSNAHVQVARVSSRPDFYRYIHVWSNPA